MILIIYGEIVYQLIKYLFKTNMNSSHSNKVVRIISHETEFDWKMPFNKSSTKTSFGSGFFIDNKGHILTNSHVIENAIKVFVEINNIEYETKIKGLCPFFDIALIQILNYKNNSYFELDNQTEIKPGMEAVTYGYPLGLKNLKITKGIISGHQYNYYQTDAPINPGNSGGPLVMNNKVIGINSAGVPAFAADGIGYAVPIQEFFTIKKELFNVRKVLIYYSEYFGFEQYQKTSKDFQKFLKNKCKSGGVYVKDILHKSPVSVTNIETGDVLCNINGLNIDYYGFLDKKWMNDKITFNNLLVKIGINKPVDITYWDGKNIKKERFKLREYKPPIRNMYHNYENIDYEVFGGMIVVNMNKSVIQKMGILELLKYCEIENVSKERLIITNILTGSYLAKLNILKPGDIIVKINKRKVNNVNKFRKAFDKKKQFIEIETEDKKMVVLPLNQIIEEEKQLSKTYNYKKSNLI